MFRDLEDWLKSVEQKSIKELRIIQQEVIPIYKILDNKLQTSIEHLFLEKERVILTGASTVCDCKWIKFDTQFKSTNYKVFGKLLKDSPSKVTKHVKFNLESIIGFAAEIEFAKNDDISEDR